MMNETVSPVPLCKAKRMNDAIFSASEAAFRLHIWCKQNKIQDKYKNVHYTDNFSVVQC